MKRRYALIAFTAVAALASTASLIAGLRHALRREHAAEPPLDDREAERQRIREIMGDLLAPPVNYDNWPEHLRPHPDLPDRDALRARMPVLDPPLSETVIEERNESR